MARKDKAQIAKIAKERIQTLFVQAEQRPSYADRYVALALKIASKNQVKIPRALRRRYCKACHVYFIPGKNVRIRTRLGKIVSTCLACKHITRFGY